MNMPPAKQKKPLSTGLLVAVILGSLVLLALATAAFFFLRYRQTASQHIDSSQSQVLIGQPQDMAQFDLGFPITVEVDAIGMQPFVSTELWINGVLEGVQAGPSGGRTSLTTIYTWVPAQPGNYSLVARAITNADVIITSPAVIVFINPIEPSDQPPREGEEVAGTSQVAPVVLPAPPSGYAGSPLPAPIDITVPAVKWKGSPGDWLTHLITTVPPAAPELTAIVDGCNVKLDIHDLSENEEGFALYRQTTNNSDWDLVADFAAHSGAGWIGYLDENMSGGITYYATAFNTKGENSSNLMMVNIDPEACPQPKPKLDISTLRLKIENLQLDGAAGNIYCYRRLGNGQWSRWPDVGFLTSDGAVKTIPQLVQPLVLSDLSDSGAIQAMRPLDLKMECWGWEGGKLRSLGKMQEKIDLAKLTGIHVAFPSLAFEILPDIFSGIKGKFFLLGEGMNPWPRLFVDPYSIEHLGYIPESDQMPFIHAWISFDKNDCMSHIEGSFEQELNCYPMPGFNAGPGGINPQAYLIWEVLDGTCEGSPEKECFSLGWWKAFANSNPEPYADPIQYRVDNIYLSPGGDAADMGISVDISQAAERVMPDFPPAGTETCWNGYKFYQVSLWVNSSIGNIAGPRSEFVAAPCPIPLGDKVNIEVNFNQVTINDIYDGVGNYCADNVYGLLAAFPNGQTVPYLRFGWWGGSEPTDYGGTNGYIYEICDGTYSLAISPFQMCLLTNPYSCDATQVTPYSYGNNKLTIPLKEGDSLQLKVVMYEFDNASNPDSICTSEVWVGPKTIEQWAATENEPYYLIQPEGDATCTLEVILNAIKQDQ